MFVQHRSRAGFPWLPELNALELPRPTAKAVLEATGATKTRAYELAQTLLGVLPDLERPVGRPATEFNQTDADTVSARLLAISGEVLHYLYARPGALTRRGPAFRFFEWDLA